MKPEPADNEQIIGVIKSLSLAWREKQFVEDARKCQAAKPGTDVVTGIFMQIPPLTSERQPFEVGCNLGRCQRPRR
jgi:hypothetical protein